MPRNLQHALLTNPKPEVRARQRFVLQLKREIERLRGRAKTAVRDHQPTDLTSDGVALEALYADEVYRTVCALKRHGQDMMWRSVELALAPELAQLSQAFQTSTTSSVRKGTLTLDPALDPGDSWRNARVHLQPGGYHVDLGPSDLTAGALYEEGGALYSRGQSVGTRESKAECAIRFLSKWKPEFRPTRILDIGCSAGSSTIPYALAFPEAEVHGIDLFPGLLRYAHAKAESLEARVHFHQADAASTKFPDGYFDLVVSHNSMHEMDDATRRAMFAESYRLLKPGGLCMHQDLPLRSSQLDSLNLADALYDQWFNGELHWADYLNCDCESYLNEAGFEQSSWHCQTFEQLDGSMSWYFAAAEKGFRNASAQEDAR